MSFARCVQVLLIEAVGLIHRLETAAKCNMKTLSGVESLLLWDATFCLLPGLSPVN
jgi:hypothetical protein